VTAALAPRWLAAEVRWNEQHPRRAPQFRCRTCRKWVALTRSLILLREDQPGPEPVILCLRCMDAPTPREAHARWYPDCPRTWHDMYDHHEHAWGSRAAIALLLGIWPGRAAPAPRARGDDTPPPCLLAPAYLPACPCASRCLLLPVRLPAPA
jgi:hypothetical protein